ncbi:TetR/AcrR family transcriptional regulator [Alicyclobacillus macrosporangiidus]|uniref:Regulatory protein, tetR family n=1 Tax=Alicyclobacillus macrosporangiidus TaxID=392015 RepID=A0A1I7KYP1_9BACL|nr:helix-turn-helix domain-containing protein [Alicyclobacillus macrosporangiidus]SFV02593.1 regulatory protein, tetR family [Alicyclobacillus macrosporangiidus]
MHKQIESGIKNLQLLAERRAILCRAAARLFRKKGYDRTTIPEIAQEAGMSVGSIYRYVKKKEDIIYLLYRETVSQLERNVYNVCAAELPPVRKTVLLHQPLLPLHPRQPRRPPCRASRHEPV